MKSVKENVSEASKAPPARGRLQPAPSLIALPTILFFVTATILMLQRTEPFVNWYYICAWYPTIVILDVLQARSSGRCRGP